MKVQVRKTQSRFWKRTETDDDTACVNNHDADEQAETAHDTSRNDAMIGGKRSDASPHSALFTFLCVNRLKDEECYNSQAVELPFSLIPSYSGQS